MEFIEFRLFWEGRINRKDLIKQFGISIPQCSTDLTQYQELAPDNMIYDTRIKAYFAAKGFTPLFLKPDSDQYLAKLRSMASGILTPDESWLSRIPAYDALPQPHRSIDPQRLRRVLEVIREKWAIYVLYQSMSKPEPEWRWITPHALGFDGYRWHVRAFCHRSEIFKDFVLARILDIRQNKAHDLDLAMDREWHEMVEVRIGPHPGLTESQRKAIELDYGMETGELVIPVRRGFLYYFLKRLGLDIDQNTRSPKDQQIIWLNREIV